MAPTFTCGPLGGHNRPTATVAPLNPSGKDVRDPVTTPHQPHVSAGAPVSSPATKSALRRTLLAQRGQAVGRGEAADAVAIALKELLGNLPGVSHKTIAGYYTIGDELDARPAMFAASAMARLCLPVTGVRGDRLIFRCWQLDEPLVSGPFGTSHPAPNAKIAEPDIILVPLLGFDGVGHRLGYGAGYYDRTLAAFRAARRVLAIGLAFDVQEVPAVPVDSNDQSLDVVITERRTLWFSSPSSFST